MNQSRILSSSLLFLLLIGIIFSCSSDSSIAIEPTVDPVDPNITSVDTSTTPCDTTLEVSYSAAIIPLLNDHCLRCHTGDTAFGGVRLDSYAGTKKVVDSGEFYGAVSWQGGYEAMPQGEDKLPDCVLQNIKTWIDLGAPNN
jgi:hypothetical protein